MYKRKYKIDKVILGILLVFMGISLLTISSARMYLPSYLGNLVLKQLMWFCIGFVIIYIMSKLKNDVLYQFVWYLYAIGILLLCLLFVFAPVVNNSRCWFVIPKIGSFQPSEFMKIVLILALGSIMGRFSEIKFPNWKDELWLLLKCSSIVILPSILTFMQPDTGAVLIYFIILLAMLFACGLRYRWFIAGGIGVIIIVGSFFALYQLNQELFIDIFGTKFFYRMDRLFDWQSGTGYQLENAITAIGSASLLGHGLYKTPLYFPESGTDFIFAVFSSNFGLLGSMLLFILLFAFDYQLLKLAKKSLFFRDKVALIGIFGMLLYQQIQNIGMTIGLLPITGITLPFISYGGSSLVSYMILIGIILNSQNEQVKRPTIT